MLHLFVYVRRHQHLLGRNAATQRTRAAKPVVFLDYGSLQTQLSGTDGRYITTRPTADNRYVKLFVSQFFRFPLVRAVMITIKRTGIIIFGSPQPKYTPKDQKHETFRRFSQGRGRREESCARDFS